jgi:hypothetical protein
MTTTIISFNPGFRLIFLMTWAKVKDTRITKEIKKGVTMISGQISRVSACLLLLFTLAIYQGCSGPKGSSGNGQAGENPPTEETTPETCDCVPGSGTDYQVGPGKQYESIEEVPWEDLEAGDTVRIFYRTEPYKGKFMIAAHGTADAPVRICGVKGPNGERPEIDGRDAVTRAALSGEYGGSQYVRDIQQSRAIVMIKPLATAGWTDFPSHIIVEGLALRHAHPDYTFHDADGAVKNYTDFGAVIWIDRGHNITIRDNEISDGQMAIFSKSTDDGDFAVTRDILVSGNYMWGNGIAGDEHMHTTYLQSMGLVVEFNRYGAIRTGAAGNSAKDRSVGATYRYNLIEDGAHAIDLVEAEDFSATATADPAYRSTYVYGNIIKKNGDTGTCIHYGGDHFGSTPGASWGEPIFRKGTLYFYNNTLYLTGNKAVIFQLSTTEEKAEVWNNIFTFDPAVAYKCMRANQEVAAPWTGGGIVNLYKNWINSGWSDSDIYHPVPGELNGTENMIAGGVLPIDAATFVPIAGSAVVDSGITGPLSGDNVPPQYQIGMDGVVTERVVNGNTMDLGAIEK